MMLSRRVVLGGMAATALLAGSSAPRRSALALDHPDTASLLSQHGVDPMVGVNPATGTVLLAWVEPARKSDEAETEPAAATPEGEDHEMAMPASGAVMVARSTDGGATFGKPVAASGSDSEVISYVGSSPLVFAGPAGEVYVAYGRNVAHDGVDFGRDILRLARSDDDGQRFAPAVDIFTDTDALEAGSFNDVVVAPDGTLYAAWLSYRQYMPENGAGDDARTEVRVARSDDGGASFGPSILVDDESCECCRTALAVGPDGALYLAWRDKEPQEDGGDPVRNMVISRSDDGGETWSSPALIHDDGWRVAQCPESGPVIGVDAAGKVHAAWFTGKDDGAGVYYATAPGQGLAFSAPAALASDEYFPHANVRGTLGESDVFWIAWDDPRTEAGAIGLVQIDESGAITPADTADLSGRTPDVALAPAGPVLTWLTDDGVQVEVIAHDEGAS